MGLRLRPPRRSLRRLVVRRPTTAAFGRRCIPPGGVALPSNTPGILGHRAWDRVQGAPQKPASFVMTPRLWKISRDETSAKLPCFLPECRRAGLDQRRNPEKIRQFQQEPGLAPRLLQSPGVRMLMEKAPTPQVSPVKVRVIGPDAACLTPTDLRRLFCGRRLTPARRERLRNSGRVVAACGRRVVGLAAYERFDGELRVHEFGVDATARCTLDQIEIGRASCRERV